MSFQDLYEPREENDGYLEPAVKLVGGAKLRDLRLEGRLAIENGLLRRSQDRYTEMVSQRCHWEPEPKRTDRFR